MKTITILFLFTLQGLCYGQIRPDLYATAKVAYEREDFVTALKNFYAYRIINEERLQAKPDSLEKIDNAILYCEKELRKNKIVLTNPVGKISRSVVLSGGNLMPANLSDSYKGTLIQVDASGGGMTSKGAIYIPEELVQSWAKYNKENGYYPTIKPIFNEDGSLEIVQDLQLDLGLDPEKIREIEVLRTERLLKKFEVEQIGGPSALQQSAP